MFHFICFTAKYILNTEYILDSFTNFVGVQLPAKICMQLVPLLQLKSRESWFIDRTWAGDNCNSLSK